MSGFGDNIHISNQKTPYINKTGQLRGIEESKLKDRKNSFKSFKEWLCNIPLFGGFFKRLFKRKVEGFDPNRETRGIDLDAPIEECLPSLVDAAQEGTPKLLADVLLRLERNNSNETFIKEKFIALDSLVKEAKSKDGNLDDLVWVLNYLNSEDRKDLLINSKNEVLALLVSKAKDRTPEYLAEVLVRVPRKAYVGLNSDNLNTVITNFKNGVVVCPVAAAKTKPGHLAHMLSKFNSGDLKNVLTNTANGVLSFIVKAAQEERPAILEDVIIKLDPRDLTAILNSNRALDFSSFGLYACQA
jgi:hypothetical protein